MRVASREVLQAEDTWFDDTSRGGGLRDTHTHTLDFFEI